MITLRGIGNCGCAGSRLSSRRRARSSPRSPGPTIPVGRPLPDVAGHVVEAVAVRRERADGRRRAVAVVGAPREVAVPVVREPLARRLGLVAPDVGRAVETAARRPLPLRLGRQRLAGPRGVGLGVLVRDVDDGLVLAPRERAARPVRRGPVRTGRPRPPLVEVAEVDRARRHREDERARDEVLGRRARETRPDRAAARRPSRSRCPQRTPRTRGSWSGTRSIPKPSTATRCAGASSG